MPGGSAGRWTIVLSVMALVWAQNASAQLSEVDLVPGSGDAKATFDAATGLYWLDVAETIERSVADVLGGSGGWVDAGWRYATASEICDLFGRYALAVPSCGGSSAATASGDVVGSLQSFLGITIDNGINRSTVGLYDDGGDPTRVGVGRLTYTVPTDTSASLVQSSATPDAALSTAGSWLVRDTPPPPPVPTFGLGVIPSIAGLASALALVGCAALSRSRDRLL